MAVRCEQCYWFDHTFRHGRHDVCCRDIGTSSADDACNQYVPRQDHNAVQEAKAVKEVSSMFDGLAIQSYQDHFIQVIADRYNVETQLTEACEEINRRLERSGASRGDHKKAMTPIVDRLLNLFVLYRLCGIVGLNAFADDIVRDEIKRRGEIYNKPKK